jgi:hypothetical protein
MNVKIKENLKPINTRYPYEIYVENSLYGLDSLYGLMYIGDDWTPMFKAHGSPEEELTASELIHIGKKMEEFCNRVKAEAERNGLSYRQWIETR